MVEIKTPGEIDAIHAAGQVVARILAAVRVTAAPGTRLSELDEAARSVLSDARAASPFLGYQPLWARSPFPAVICVSVNDAALHGIPGRRRLSGGDLVSVDAGAVLGGWAADAAISFTVGSPKAGDTRLIEAASDALRAGIATAVPGARVGDISAAVSRRRRNLLRLRRARRRPRHARRPARPQRRPGRPWPPVAAGACHRGRTLVPGRRPG